jgi:hypothetical protein
VLAGFMVVEGSVADMRPEAAGMAAAGMAGNRKPFGILAS